MRRVAAATATYHDPDYQECVKLLSAAVERDICIVEGTDYGWAKGGSRLH